MQLMTRGGRLMEVRMPSPPGTPWGDTTPPTNGMLGVPVGGVAVNEKAVMGIAAVWACVGILADAVSTLPLRQYRGNPRKTATAREVDPSPLLIDPWPDAGLTAVDFYGGGQVSLGLRGNFIGRVVDRDKNFLATMVQPFDPDEIRVQRDRAGNPEYRVNGERKPIDLDDVFHVRNVMRSGTLLGLNPIENLRTSFGLARAEEEYAASFFANSANPSGALYTEEDLSEEETLALARAWMMSHQGIGKAQMPAVLTGGLRWEQITMNMEDAQFIESRQLTRSDVAMIFRIPPHMIGDVDRTTSWGTGIEQQELGFVRTTLLGYLRRWEAALSAQLPPGQFAMFDLSERLRGDTLQRFQAYTLARNGGWMNVDEIRAAENQPELPDGQGKGYLQPANMGPLGGPGTGAPTDPMSPDPAAEKSPSGLSKVLLTPTGRSEQEDQEREERLLATLLETRA